MAVFGARHRAHDLEVELARAQGLLTELGGLDELRRDARRREGERALADLQSQYLAVQGQIEQSKRELTQARGELVETRVEQQLQTAGIYAYAHPLENAVAYRRRSPSCERR